MSKVIDDVLALAKKQVGVMEKPANSNNVKYNTWFYGHAVHGSDYSWCATFIVWLFYHCDGSKYVTKNANAAYLQDDIVNKKGGKWIMKKTASNSTKKAGCKKMKAGDIVTFDFGRNNLYRYHIGIFAYEKGGLYYCYEGNTSKNGSQSNGGMVCLKARKYTDFCAIARTKAGSGKEEPVEPQPLKVDGDFGDETKCRLQKWLGVTEDGDIGKATVKALQKKIGVKDVDGAWGAITTKKLQQYLDARGYTCEVDGVLGKQTIKALQKFLNAVFFGGNIDVVNTPKPEKVTDPQPQVDAVNLKKVIDISAWQGKVTKANFLKVKGDGVKAVILRTSYTTQSGFNLHKDKVFDYNYKKAKAAGLLIGVYHYSQATTVKEARQEAQYVLGIIKGLQIDLPVTFDWEFGGRLNSTVAKKKGKDGCKKICDAFCNVIKEAGFTPMVYANLYTFNNYIQDDIYKSWKIWIAQYSRTCDYKHPYYLWQYTSSGKVAGLNGRIDMNKG